MANVIFSFNGFETIIQCLKENKMKDICQKFITKMNMDINSVYFIYGGGQLNLDLTFQQHANSLDKENNQMNILVYKYDSKEELICPKCGEKIKLDKKIIDNIIISNNDINDTLIGIKSQNENIFNLIEYSRRRNMTYLSL